MERCEGVPRLETPLTRRLRQNRVVRRLVEPYVTDTGYGDALGNSMVV